MRQKIISGIITIFMTGFLAFSQDIKMVVVKEKWQVIPLFAVTDTGEAVTNLKKTDIEFLLNGQNTREFLLLKKTFTRSAGKNRGQEVYSEAPGLKRGKVIILLFDTLFANKKALGGFADIARKIVLRTNDNIKYLVVTTDSSDVSISTAIPLKNKNYILNKIRDKVVSGARSMYNPDARIKLFSQTFNYLYEPVKRINANIFMYIFSTGIPKGDWRDFKDMAALYIEHINGVVFFIDPAKPGEGDDFIRSLSEKCGGKTISGNKDCIVKELINLHRSYYEIIIPGLKEYKGSLRRMSIASTREHVALHTIKTWSKEGNRSLANIFTPGKPGKAAAQPGKEPVTAILTLKKELKSTRELLSANRYNLREAASQLLCGEAFIYLKQGALNKALNSLQMISLYSGRNIDFVHQAITKLQKILRMEKEIKEVLTKVMSVRKKSRHKHVSRLHNKVNEILAGVEENENSAESIKTALKEMQKIIDQSREQTNLFDSSINELKNHLKIKRQKKSNNPNLSKAENYKIMLAAFENLPLTDPGVPGGYKNIIKKIFSHLKSAVNESVEHVNFTGQALEQIRALDSPACCDFVIKNNDQFSLEFRKPFYKKKLEYLGADPGLLTTANFIDVVSHTPHFYKNDKGYWEGVFANETILIYIPAGKFTMGIPWETGGAQDESPRHEVFVDGCWIAKYETTFKQFDHFCDTNKRRKPVDSNFGRKKHPAINISWNDIVEYCDWLFEKSGLHFRLPTEAEWEKAARGPAGWKYPWGNAKPDGEKANYADQRLYIAYGRNHPAEAFKGNTSWMDKDSDDGYPATSPVGKYPAGASPYGVMDMSGNVWEFVMDWYDGDYFQHSPGKNPRGPGETGFKVVRGGGWDSHHWMLRSTTRAGGVPGKTSDVLGFRAAVGIDFD